MSAKVKRIRPRRPTALTELINQYLEDHNLTYKQLAELTEATAKRLGVKEGVNYNVIGDLSRGTTRDPKVRNLWLVGLTIGKTLGDMLQALGYEPSALQTAPIREDAEQAKAMVAAATPEDVERVRRVLSLDPTGRMMLDAYLDASEARMRQQDGKK